MIRLHVAGMFRTFLSVARLTNYGISMAGALLASLPTLLVYILLSKYFLAGLMQGSVKG